MGIDKMSGISHQKTETINHFFTVNGNYIFRMICEKYEIPEDSVKTVSVTLEVPRGGDYSGMKLDVFDYPIVVSFSQENHTS